MNNSEIMPEKIVIFLAPYIFSKHRTGGELYYKYLKDFLENQKGVKIIIPDEKDRQVINRPKGVFFINWWFFLRLIALPRGSVVIEDQMICFAYFLANWLTKYFHKSIRIVTIVHETSFKKYKGLNRIKNKIITYLFYRSSDCIMVNSEYIGIEVASLGGRAEKIEVRLYPGQQFNIKAMSKKENNTEVNILCVANIRPKKGQKYLIEALKLLKKYEFRATLAGSCNDDRYERELCLLIKEYGLEDRVKIVGWLEGESMAEAYQEANIFVLPSLYEPLGLVIYEAMQFGLPIIASDTGGIPEQVTNLREALLVPPEDPAALAKAIERLLTDSDLRNRLVKNAYQSLKNRLTWEEVLEYDMSLILSNLRPII